MAFVKHEPNPVAMEPHLPSPHDSHSLDVASKGPQTGPASCSSASEGVGAPLSYILLGVFPSSLGAGLSLSAFSPPELPAAADLAKPELSTPLHSRVLRVSIEQKAAACL